MKMVGRGRTEGERRQERDNKGTEGEGYGRDGNRVEGRVRKGMV